MKRKETLNAYLERPAIGTEIRVLYKHWFFLNSEVPACRIRHLPGTVHLWTPVDPDDKKGLIVFVPGGLEIKPSCIIVITEVQNTVCLGREIAAFSDPRK